MKININTFKTVAKLLPKQSDTVVIFSHIYLKMGFRILL
jgi:hypothetical protein